MGSWNQIFGFEIDVNGAKIIVVNKPQLGGCLSDGEIDGQISMIKSELDQLAKKMKKAIKEQELKNRKTGLF